MKIKNVTILAIFWIIIVLSLYIIIIFKSGNIDKFRDDRYYTIYDSETFFEPLKNITLFELKEISGWGEGNFTYLGYPVYLLLYKGILNFFGIKIITYKVALLSNLILLIIAFILYYKALIPKKDVHVLLYILAFIDFSLISFSLTIERELFAAVILALIVLQINKGLVNKKWNWILITILFFISMNIRILLPVVVIISLSLYYGLIFFKRIKGVYKYYFLILFITILIIFIRKHFVRIDDLLLTGQDGTGIGSIIASLPLFGRVFGYSSLFFVAPIPATNLFNKVFIFPYEYFLPFSGITYLFYWLYLVKNYRLINKDLLYIFIAVAVCHALSGGLLYNIRHRTDVIVLLVILFLKIVKLKVDKGNTVKNIINEAGLLMIISIIIIVSLHIIYYVIKWF